MVEYEARYGSLGLEEMLTQLIEKLWRAPLKPQAWLVKCSFKLNNRINAFVSTECKTKPISVRAVCG